MTVQKQDRQVKIPISPISYRYITHQLLTNHLNQAMLTTTGTGSTTKLPVTACKNIIYKVNNDVY